MSLVVYSIVMSLQTVPRMHETKRQHHTTGEGWLGDTVQKYGNTVTKKKTESDRFDRMIRTGGANTLTT